MNLDSRDTELTLVDSAKNLECQSIMLHYIFVEVNFISSSTNMKFESREANEKYYYGLVAAPD